MSVWSQHPDVHSIPCTLPFRKWNRVNFYNKEKGARLSSRSVQTEKEDGKQKMVRSLHTIRADFFRHHQKSHEINDVSFQK